MGQSLQVWCNSCATQPQELDLEIAQRDSLLPTESASHSPTSPRISQMSESEDELDRGPGYPDDSARRTPTHKYDHTLSELNAYDDLSTTSEPIPSKRKKRGKSTRISDSALSYNSEGSRTAYYDFRVDPFIAQMIMTDPRFEEKKLQLEEEVSRLPKIISVEYIDEDAAWAVTADSASAMRKCKHYLDIVAWRMLVIPQWRSESNAVSRSIRPADGVWYYEDVLGFMSDFGMEDEARNDLQLIDDVSDNYDYLADKRDLPLNSPQFLEFASKVAQIRYARTVEIVVIGSRIAVTDFIRQTRMLEIEHPVMRQFLEAQARKKNFKFVDHNEITPIPEEHLRVSGFPDGVTRQEIALFFGKLCRVLDVELYRHLETDAVIAIVNFADAKARATALRESKTKTGIVWDGMDLLVETIEDEDIPHVGGFTGRKRRRQRSLRRLF